MLILRELKQNRTLNHKYFMHDNYQQIIELTLSSFFASKMAITVDISLSIIERNQRIH